MTDSLGETPESAIPCLKPFWQNKYKTSAGKNWNNFYKRNSTNFYKDRHWLDHEFPNLLTRPEVVGLEVGCGVGNLIFPALERNATLKLFACDFSETAIRLVQQHEAYAELHQQGRIDAFVCDISLPAPFSIPGIQPDSLDFVTCVFVLSAIPPAQHVRVLESLRDVLAPDGVICFRDYAAGDSAQRRFQQRSPAEVAKLEDFLYVRQDGTMSYFFRESYFRSLVHRVEGLGIESLDVLERRTTNVKKGLDEKRQFLQAVIKRT